MSEKPPITTLAEARDALDAEIAGAREGVAYAEREAAKATATADGARSKLYALTTVRDRMEPQA